MKKNNKNSYFKNYSFAGKKIEFPRVWVSYIKPLNSLEEDIIDMKKHGVRGVEIQRLEESWPELIKLGKKYNMKYGISITDITERKNIVEKHGLEPVPAIMIGGAYQGKAIDHNLFSFTADKHTIEIEEPVYDKENCYDDVGRYFPNMGYPVKAEIIIPLANYDGKQHLNIIEANIAESSKDNHYRISFDLRKEKGDLSRVGIAVYWEYEGTDKYWIFGRGNVTSWAESTKEALRREVKEKVNKLKEINGGEFPHDQVIIARFGDECFHITGHLNSEECSYPLWDYSQMAIEKFKELRPDDEYPRTWGFPEIYGPDAYGDWMYLLHKGCAELCDVVREAFRNEGTDVQVFRNITRMNVFNVTNYRDGTGLEMLVKQLDITHLDPYPCGGPDNYHKEVIPQDMGYISGLARRYNKDVIPWLQAHSYWASKGGLDHPSPEQIKKMVNQHMQYNTLALMWLQYPGTFGEKPITWEVAKKMHKKYVNFDQPKIEADIAIIRFYNVWGLLTSNDLNIMDKFITDKVINWLEFEKGLPYDAIESRNSDSLNKEQLENYDIIITSLPPSGSNLLKLLRNNKKSLVFCDNIKYLKEVSNKTGIKNISPLTDKKAVKENNKFKLKIKGIEIETKPLFKVTLKDEIDPIIKIKDIPLFWEYQGIIFTVIEPDLQLKTEFLNWLFDKYFQK